MELVKISRVLNPRGAPANKLERSRLDRAREEIGVTGKELNVLARRGCRERVWGC